MKEKMAKQNTSFYIDNEHETSKTSRRWNSRNLNWIIRKIVLYQTLMCLMEMEVFPEPKSHENLMRWIFGNDWGENVHLEYAWGGENLLRRWNFDMACALEAFIQLSHRSKSMD